MTDASQEAKAPDGVQRKKSRGAGFPSIPLGMAVQEIKKVASFGAAHTADTIAGHLGHNTANSGPFRGKLAALKDFGLVSGRGGELFVTSLGMELTHPGTETDTEELMRRAFRSCSIFAELLDSLSTNVDLQISGVASNAVHKHGIAPGSKDAFATSFVKSAEAAGLIEMASDNAIRVKDNSSPVRTEESRDDAGRRENGRNASKGQDTGSGSRNIPQHNQLGSTPVINHFWPLSGGSMALIVEYDKPLPATAYGLIQGVIEAGDKLAEMLGIPQSPGDDDDAE